jgi:tetratricopeptide (TPR) repeat protein
VTAHARTSGGEARPDFRPDNRVEARIEKRPHGVRDELAKAGEALAAGRNTEAIQLLRKVLAADPANQDARANLIAVLSEREGREEWLAALSDAAIADPARWGVAAAQAFAEQGQHGRAAALLQSVPTAVRDARYWSLAGLVHGKLERHQASLDAWDQALALTPPDTARHHATQIARAVALERLGRGRTRLGRSIRRSWATPTPPANVLSSFARSRLVTMGATGTQSR